MVLTRARLRELLHYNPRTGVFTWLDTPEEAHAAYVKAARKYCGEFARAK